MQQVVECVLFLLRVLLEPVGIAGASFVLILSLTTGIIKKQKEKAREDSYVG